MTYNSGTAYSTDKNNKKIKEIMLNNHYSSLEEIAHDLEISCEFVRMNLYIIPKELNLL